MKPVTAQELAAALKRREYPDPPLQLLAEAVNHIADELAPAGNQVPKQDIRNVMDILRRHRHFDHMHLVGLAWHDTRRCDALIQRLLAQAAVELGAFERADELLDEADKAAAASPKDLDFIVQAADYQGLRGRIRKQKSVLTEDVNLLVEATECYQKQLGSKPSFFLGVNVLALRTRLHDLGIDHPGPPLAALAHEVLGQAISAARSDPVDPWPLATASEACLALNRIDPGHEWCDKAELWLYRFLGHPGAGPFEVESYFRQVRELWKGNPLDGSLCSGRLAKIFERHVMRTQHRWSADARQLQRLQDNPGELEKNFSGEKAFTVDDVRKMLAISPNIGCVTNTNGVRMGTGFLMPGAAFGKPYPLVFVTNAHVISDTVPKALKWEDARVTFEIEAASGVDMAHRVQEVLYTSEPGKLGNVADAPGKLDVTVCLLRSTPKDASGLSVATSIPLPSPNTKAFVVGHPQAGEMQFSLQDSVLMDVCPQERLMHYRTPTDPGSSGSPVFNQDWEVVALHHAGSQACPRFAGSGTYEANEGITLQAIRRGTGVNV
ncbi:serine protease [Variovorax sp. YR216]|uniref:serine protease n=1 Tax=Variovorax sp. YR216 TaxID=1882828 RepID=UPI000895A346|nr:serine protease [Variovorax sp. YR216]SEB22701.1 V8-like Glu-specific endopeptidase [Variovorax sp. YR216]